MRYQSLLGYQPLPSEADRLSVWLLVGTWVLPSFETLYSNFSEDGSLIDGLECARGTVEAPASELRSSWALSMAS